MGNRDIDLEKTMQWLRIAMWIVIASSAVVAVASFVNGEITLGILSVGLTAWNYFMLKTWGWK